MYPIKSCVIFKFANLGEKDKDCSLEWLVNTYPGFMQYYTIPISNDNEGKYFNVIH